MKWGKIMKTKITLLAVLLLIMVFVAQSQENNKTQETMKTLSDLTAKDYEDLLAKLKGGDTNIDFKTFRMAYTKTSQYNYKKFEKEGRIKFYQPFNDKNYKEAFKQVEKFIEKYPIEIDGYYYAYKSVKELGDENKAKFYKAILLGLLNSIQDGKDGLSEESAFEVISISEEENMIRFSGYSINSKRETYDSNGHTFDKFSVINKNTGEIITIYFNIDIFTAAEKKESKKK